MPVPQGPVAQNVEFVWHGEEIKRSIAEAIRGGLEETGEKAVEFAQAVVNVDTGALQADITSRVPPRRGGVWVLRFGAFRIRYAFWQEILPPPYGKAYIRPAADAEFPKIGQRISVRLPAKYRAGFADMGNATRIPIGYRQEDSRGSGRVFRPYLDTVPRRSRVRLR